LVNNGFRNYLVYLFASLIMLAGAFGVYDDVAVSAGGMEHGAASKGTLSQLPPPFPGVQRLHLVLIGADERPNDVGRSDTLIVMWLNPERKKAALMSVPRDLKVGIPGHGRTKVNAAFAYGGAPLTAATVEQLIGVKTDGYLKVNFTGFCAAVDALGGVDLLVPDVEGEGRGMNYDDNWGNLHVHLSPGRHHLSGYEAMGYCRYRKSNYANLGDGDGGRAARQQQFIKAMVEQKLRVTNVPGLLKAGREVMGCVETNLTWRQCVDLARLLKEMNQSDIRTVTIPVVDGVEGGVWFSNLIDSAFREMLAEIDRHLDSTISAVCRVEVLDGSGGRGLARAASEALTKAGFRVIDGGEARGDNYDATRIRYRPGSQSLASSAAAALGVGKLEPASTAPTDTAEGLVATDGQTPEADAPLQITVGADYEVIIDPTKATPGRRKEPGPAQQGS
jgi:polyisoprenyl-teichoic acid--peptidoglycan teichoic acid transferase